MNRNWINGLFCFIMFHFAMALLVISPLLIEITKTYFLTMAQSGLIFTLCFLGFVIFVFIGGILADMIGKKNMMLIALAGFSLSLLLVILASDYLIFCLLIFFIGGFGGAVETVLMSTVPDVNETKIIFYQNLVQVFFGAGALVGPLAAGLLVSAGMNWKNCFLILGIIGSGITVLFALTKLPDKRSQGGFSLSCFRELFRDPKFLLICLCIFFYTGSEVGSWGWMSTFLKNNLGFTLTKASLAVGIFWIAMTIGRFICGWLLFRFKTSHIIAVLAYASVAVTLSSLFITDETVSLIQVALMGFAFSSIWPLIVAYGGEYRKTSSSTMLSLLVGSGGIGGMVIPFLMGLIASVSDTKLPMLLPSLSLLFVGIFFTALIMGGKKKAV